MSKDIQILHCVVCVYEYKIVALRNSHCFTTETFLMALRRFIVRRGQPTDLYSDNGKTYVKASSELKRLGPLLQQNYGALSNMVINRGIQWHFISAYSPNFDGLWEAGVKYTKHHLKRVLGNASTMLEQFRD